MNDTIVKFEIKCLKTDSNGVITIDKSARDLVNQLHRHMLEYTDAKFKVAMMNPTVLDLGDSSIVVSCEVEMRLEGELKP